MFKFPRVLNDSISSIKKGRAFLSPLFSKSAPVLLEYRGDVVGVVGFVRLAKVALTAELRRRCCLACAELALQVRVVGAVDEEVGGIVGSAAVSLDRASCGGRVNCHH